MNTSEEFSRLENERTWKIERFEIRREHLKLIQRMNVGWSDVEYGAPEIDPKRPYGNSDVEDDIREILQNPSLTDEECAKLNRETKMALQICLTTQSFKAGRWTRHKYHDDWVFTAILPKPLKGEEESK